MPLWMMCTIMGIALVVLVVIAQAMLHFTEMFQVDRMYETKDDDFDRLCHDLVRKDRE